MSQFIEEEVVRIRELVGTRRVICGLLRWGRLFGRGVLLVRAIGTQLSCIFVDNGMLRAGGMDAVRDRFLRHFKTDLHVVDAHAIDF